MPKKKTTRRSGRTRTGAAASGSRAPKRADSKESKKAKKALSPRRPRARGKELSRRKTPAKPAAADAALERRSRLRESQPLLIAGIGASAGGLEALSDLLKALPANPGMAFVFVQHLAPTHESSLPMLLSSRTTLAVVEAAEGMRVEADHLYVIPPNVQMSLRKDALHLAPRPSDATQYTPIDHFLCSLAQEAQDRSVAVILSGTASDGTLGIREIKAVGGITIAQSPETAKYDGMPRAALESGFVDLALSPTQIAAELVSIARHPLTQRPRLVDGESAAGGAPTPEPAMDQVFTLLRAASGVDFRRYKRPTIDRRLHRRMVLHKLTRLEDYARHLRENPTEVKALYDDILIHVTRFFRDPEVFDALAAEVVPRILERQSDDRPVRVWVPGCSTGEEAYSVAIVLLEILAKHERAAPVQIFATDISDGSIAHARSGVYPRSIADDVSEDRLRRHFSSVEGGYRINKAVRDLCVFARQDLTRDPPFSKLDLIVCRNLLIYLGADLQKKLLSVFHYALKPSGYLMLGSAETIGPQSDLFAPADRKHRIFEKKAGQPIGDLHFHVGHGPPVLTRARPAAPAGRDDARSVEAEATRLIQERFAPPGVIVDENLNVVQFRGQMGSYLEPAPGEPSLHLFKMAREGLLHALRDGLQESRKNQAPVRRNAVRVRTNGGWRSVSLEIVPLTAGETAHFLILFDEDRKVESGGRRASKRARGGGTETVGGEKPNERVTRLQRELASSREYLQSIIQDLEAANEELQSANEEVLSANEELQSTNEELDTAKEELQSTNEELNTVNEELHGRNEELSRVNSDLVNLLSSVQIAIVIVAADLRIRRFTPMAERVLNLIAGDIGRPIGHIKPNVDCPDLEQLILQVIETVTPCERQVRDSQGQSFLLRIRPYKNLENRIDGAVLALFDSRVPGSEDQTPNDGTASARQARRRSY